MQNIKYRISVFLLMNKFSSDISVIKAKQSQKNPGTYLREDLVTKSLDFLFHNCNSILLIASAGALPGIFLLLCLSIQSDRTFCQFSLTNTFQSNSIFLFRLSSSQSAIPNLDFSLYIWKSLQCGVQGPRSLHSDLNTASRFI